MHAQASALALASGGARGAYQAGALLYLAEQGLTFDLVAGTSIGALNGAYYAQGDGSAGHLQKLCELWRAASEMGLLQVNGQALLPALALLVSSRLSSFAALAGQVGRGPFALLDPRPVERLLDHWIDYEKVCGSRIDLTITVLRELDAVIDIMTGPWRAATYLRARELGPAALRQALLAAAAIPLAYPSQRVGGNCYSDAALSDPLPARVLHQRGAKRIVSIFLADETIQDRADYPDCVLFQIRPSVEINTSYATTFDFSRDAIERLINLGYHDARNNFECARALYVAIIELRARGTANQKLADSLPER
jgi:NTE family protein